MITDSDVRLVLRAYRAYARGDIAAAVADLDPDVEWVEPDEFPDGGARHGPAAVTEYLSNSRARWAELVSEPTAYRRGEDVVIVHHVTGRLHDGTAAEVTVADVHTVRDGRVVRMHAYVDPAEVLPTDARPVDTELSD
jgi:ketosteroid isomerase-like protein